MRVLFIHNEGEYFAGAEKVFGYFLQGLTASQCDLAAAVVKGSRVSDVIPPGVLKVWIPAKQQFSVRTLLRQVRPLLAARREFPFDVVHGWTARDWELTSLVGRLARRPAVGTLHDHPKARFIFPKRRLLMRCCARYGLRRTVCVSQAVRNECLRAGYPPDRLAVVHNGLPHFEPGGERKANAVVRIGFLGVISERKGVGDLFLALEELIRTSPVSWQAAIAGAAQETAGERLLEDIRQRFSGKSWWPRVQWLGWVGEPVEFLKSLDLLMVPSSDFDPFPTVLLEAAAAGVPVLAARVGGVEEIVVPGKTGWLFEPGDWRQAAALLGHWLSRPEQLRAAGREAFERINREFTVAKMVENYQALYSTLVPDV